VTTGGVGGEMTQTLYAYINKKKRKRKPSDNGSGEQTSSQNISRDVGKTVGFVLSSTSLPIFLK
jgi:hypothetical protein